jgi:hypothetical protein
MRWFLAAAGLAIVSTSGAAERRPILYDATALNIGINCQWQRHCMARQRSAMNRALTFVERNRPPQWRVELCNRNAGRSGYRVDWIGFDHCIRNSLLRPASLRMMKRARRSDSSARHEGG